MIIDTELSNFYLNTIKDFKNKCSLYIPYKSEIEKIALKKGFSIIYEVFVDRNYNDDLTLVDRNNKDAIINEPLDGVDHVMRMVKKNQVKTISGNLRNIKAETICIHGDQNNAIDFAKNISIELSKIGHYEKKF